MLRRIFLWLSVLLCLVPASPATNAAVKRVSLPVVMYHHISEKAALWNDFTLSPLQFQADMLYLKEQGYETVTVSDLLAWQAGTGSLPNKPVMVTFDDGYESTAVYALPILEELGLRAVVSPVGCFAQAFSDTEDHNLDYSHMSWTQIAQLDAGGRLEFQCHTYDMHKLSPRKGCLPLPGEDAADYAQALQADFTRFQALFSAHCGHEALALALPYGFYTAETIEAASAAGFQLIFTCEEQMNTLEKGTALPLILGRYNRPNGADSATFFSAWA